MTFLVQSLSPSIEKFQKDLAQHLSQMNWAVEQEDISK